MPGIIIVEDESIVALDMRNCLSDAGYLVSGVYASGEDLIADAERLDPELVIMDVKIQGRLDGVETANILRERWHTPVILLTAYADDDTIARAKLTQPFGYLLKPFESRELKTAIEIALSRAAMEKALRASEERYRGLFEGGLTGNFLADPSGRILESNPAFRAIVRNTGAVSMAECFGKERTTSLLHLVAAEGRLEQVELETIRPGMAKGVALANFTAAFGKDRQVVWIQGEVIDVTERRNLEARLLQSQKMEAIGRLAGGIAHDFNNIITAILGYANLLLVEGDGYPISLDDIEGIRTSARRAADLTRQLLTFSRVQRVEPHTISAAKVIHEEEKMLRRIVSEDTALSIEARTEEDTVFIDPTQFEQVIMNLVLNARDAMPSGGPIRVVIDRIDIDREMPLLFETAIAGPYVKISVIDLGVGIERSALELIFEPFYTTKPKERGTGLGLSTAFGIVKQAKGYIDVQTELGKGSAFSIYLPYCAGKEEEGLDSAERARGQGKGERLLVVEDDEALRAITAKILEKAGYTVRSAADPETAIGLAKEWMPELLIADVALPRLSGTKTAERIRTFNPGMRVLYVSGYPDRLPEDGEGRASLEKPFTETSILEAIGLLLHSSGPESRPR